MPRAAPPQSGLPPGVLYFLHIPKTAGSSLRAWLETMFAPREICPARKLPPLLRIPREELATYRFFGGHLGLYLLRVLDSPPAIVTLLRDPLSRSISHYRDIRSRPEHPLFGQVRPMPLEQFVLSEIGEAELLNLQCRYLALDDLEADFHGHGRLARADPAALREKYADPALLARARAAVDRLEVVGISERVDEAAAEIAGRFGWSAPGPVGRLNEATDPFASEELTPAVLERIRELTGLDQALYDHVRRSVAARAGRGAGRGTGRASPGVCAPSHIAS